jgi:hypothetical protein
MKMSNLMLRILGLSLVAGSGAFLIWLAEVSFQPVKPWSDALVAIGMPMMLILVLAGCGILALGLWLMVRRGRKGSDRLIQPGG